MKKVKVILATTIIAIMMCVYAINVFAAVTANITLTPRKTTVAAGEEFTVEVKAENIDAGASGLTKIEGTLSYDDKVLNDITSDNQIEGMSGWKINFDTFSKRITATTTAPVKANGPLFQISFKAKADAGAANNTGINLSGGNQQSLSLSGTSATNNTATNIEFKSIKLEGGLENGTANDVSTTINIGKASTATPTPAPAPSQPSITPQPSQPTQPVTPAPVQPAQPKVNPKAGIEDAPMILMAALAIVATISFVMLKKTK